VAAHRPPSAGKEPPATFPFSRGFRRPQATTRARSSANHATTNGSGGTMCHMRRPQPPGPPRAIHVRDPARYHVAPLEAIAGGLRRRGAPVVADAVRLLLDEALTARAATCAESAHRPGRIGVCDHCGGYQP